MKKERKVIEQNAIVVFDRDTKASKLNELFQNFQGDIVVNGKLIVDEEGLSIGCNNLYVMGKIEIYDYGRGINNICLDGNLFVEKYIDCTDIKVNGCLCCRGNIDSFNINVTEDLYVKGYIGTNGYDINVGGELVCDGAIDAAEVIVLQKIKVAGQIKFDSISVG